VIVPFTSGSTLDIMARYIAESLIGPLGQNIVIESRPGANGIIGSSAVASAQPDGYTMLLATGSFTGNIVFYRKLPYDGRRDFAPITQVARSYGLVLAVRPSLGIDSAKALIAYAKSNPGKLTFASSGYGNMTHVVGEMMNAFTGVRLVHVPYKGSGQALTDVLGGQVDMTFISTVAVQPYIKDGRVRALGLTGGQRSPVLPDVPTFKELGYPQFEMTGWYGMWFPAKTPQALVNRIQSEVAKAVVASRLKGRLEEAGLVGVASTPREFAKFLEEDIALQAHIAKEAGIKPQ
jgi:tripartite-type tricarboxylate transporter receptor subunit TctC